LFELKATKSPFGPRIAAGAYSAMSHRIITGEAASTRHCRTSRGVGWPQHSAGQAPVVRSRPSCPKWRGAGPGRMPRRMATHALPSTDTGTSLADPFDNGAD
jgi:hypothetical protein